MLLDHFWNVFVADALLGNFDRHNGNWGFLVSPGGRDISLAPVYDCGSCLLPQADERVMREVLSDEKALAARVYQFPTSAIKVSGRKINYYDFLTTTENADCRRAVERIGSRVDLDKIGALIDNTPYISELQKEFYRRYVAARFERILQPSMELAQRRTGPTMQQSF